MRKPRIFISHSSRDGDASSTVRDALANALRADAYPVLLDRDELVLGENWRSTLNMWMRGCDAAIVLLSERALASRFVAYEASVLTYRNDVDDRFLLIPVFIDPVSNSAVQESPLAPTRIHDVQTIISGKPQAEIIQTVLDQLAQHEAATEVHHHTRRLMRILRNVPEDVLEEAADELSVSLGAWVPPSELQLALAMKMMGLGLARSTVDTVMNLDPYLPDPAIEAAAEIADLVGSSWVDSRSVNELPRAVQQRSPVGINGVNPLTAIMYVIQACPRPPGNKYRWRAVQIDGVTGEMDDNSASVMKEQVQKALLIELFGGLEDEEDDALDSMLEGLRRREVHVFVVLPAVTREVLQALQAAYPAVTFFVMLGEERPSAEALQNTELVYLEPDLAAGQEKYYCTLYHEERNFLTNPLL